MALGRHWEWRGFGGVSNAFVAHFAALEPFLAQQEVEDVYIWAPHFSANIKVRTAGESGLKFKRFCASAAPFELWEEDPEEFFAFPLSPAAWQALAALLAQSGVELRPYPAVPPDRSYLLATVQQSGCRIVPVCKQREMRVWQGSHGRVLVELARIVSPERIVSIGMEPSEPGKEGEKARADLLAALSALRLDREALVAANYLQAVGLWARGKSIKRSTIE